MNGEIVVFRGGGDVATGAIQKFHRVGFRVLVLETSAPMAVRRKVSVSEAIYEKRFTVEDIVAVKCEDEWDILYAWEHDEIPVVIDPTGKYIQQMKPLCVVDGIIAKKNLGTRKQWAPITIALGPGFYAGIDVDAVIETNRGHDLGRIIFDGEASPNTGHPGNIMGYTTERVLYSPKKGTIRNLKQIGDVVKKDEVIAYVGEFSVASKLDGVVRGLIRDRSYVKDHMKIGDVDPRIEHRNYCFSISDKARAIGGATLEAMLMIRKHKHV